MSTLRIIRLTAWAAVGLITFVFAAVTLGWWRVDGPGRPDTAGVEIKGSPQIGGNYTLVDHRGRTVTNSDFEGQPMMVFFGFTHCPDVCPTTLFELTNRLKVLGAEADRLQVLFITADPERDTPEQLALYLQSFDPRIVGLSGTQEQVDVAIAAYKAIAKKAPLASGGYNVDHTASMFMMDSTGKFAGMIDHHESEQMALAKMRRLAAR
ncbi:MAG: SCO family protein [Beijerinckiaceae bacterium]